MMQHGNEVLIVGGGLAGCMAAARLLRHGIRVRLIDRLTEPLDEFRAEQIVGAQTDKLRALGVLPALGEARGTCLTSNYQRGTLLDRVAVEQYGLSYQAMVKAARAALPPGCMVAARVKRVETSASTQTVHLADGQTLTARLVVLATGLLPHLSEGLGIEWEMKSEAHSLCLGFNIALVDPRAIARIPLTYYGETLGDRIDYLALFFMNDVIRANLFCYNRRDDAWTRDFVDRPDEILLASLPGLRQVIGAIEVMRPIQMRKNDLKVAANVIRDGVVLIGDAFQTPCPAAGHGIDRILSDVSVLERLVPAWLTTDGLAANKVAQYYVDPVKRAFDAECLRVAFYRRDVSTNATLRWRVHRCRVDLQRRIREAMRVGRRLDGGRPESADLLEQ